MTVALSYINSQVYDVNYNELLNIKNKDLINNISKSNSQYLM